MKKTIVCLSAAIMAISCASLISCGNEKTNGGTELTGTALIVKQASEMSLEELEAKSKEEMKPGKTFKVVGLSSVLATAADAFAKKYDWLNYVKKGTETDKYNIYVNNSYKDAALFTALDNAADSYFADFAMVQDARSLGDYIDGNILFNYVPKDHEALGLAENDTMPLKAVHFNKVFFYNKNLLPEGRLNNVWQLAGTAEDEGHLNNLSFQSPVTEQINMSFLLSLYTEEAQARLTAAYKDFYGKDYVKEEGYKHIGEKYVAEFLKNVKAWHSSDGTAMKETQAKETAKEGQDPFIYYGAFAKMKDAAKKNYDLDANPDTPDVNAMTTVKWDADIKGFNGFMYTMYSQICNNAENPYTACLFARFLLLPETYKAMCYNELTPDKDGTPGNQYGYYSPVTSDLVRANTNDWSRDKWIEKSIVEDYNFLKTIKAAQVNNILSIVAKNPGTAA